jgi:predicted nucleotidyltransferase
MNFCGIICEFNPFHNGHEYIIQQAKKLTNSEVVCLMSGDFVQRGEPAITDKYTRAKFAVNSGASAVLELPTIYACSNAENFAYGAVKILNALGVKYLAFGIEETSLEVLKKIANLKFENSDKFQTNIKSEIENGKNFNTALKRGIAKTLESKDIFEILEKPNNILAVEYLTALLKTNSKIIPVAIERIDNGFCSLEKKQNYASATALRKELEDGNNISNYVPKNANLFNFFNKNYQKTLKTLQILKIKQISETELSKLYDYNEGLEFRIKKACQVHQSFDEIESFIVSPRYRISRINKLLLYPLLNITKEIIALSKITKPYAKVLAINKEKKELLSKNKSKINLIASNNDYKNLSQRQGKIVQIDLDASTIYNTIFDNQILDDKKQGTIFL